MNRVYQIVEMNGTVPIQFSSKAISEEGVFRAFAKKHFKLLKEGTIYDLYVNVDFGFQKIGAAYWNGKAFVKVACKLTLENPYFKRHGDSYVHELQKVFDK